MRGFRLITLIQLALTGAAGFAGAFVTAATAQTQVVSVNRDGSGTANGNSAGSAFSADGRVLAFVSSASDLLSSDTRGQNVYVRDLETGVTTLVSADYAGNGGANNQCFRPVLSGDGRFVAFESTATNLVANDTNGNLLQGRLSDVFVRDVQLGVTHLVSVNHADTDSGNEASFTPSITPDGRYVAFYSSAKNLVTNPTHADPGFPSYTPNVFVRDLQTATTELVSVSVDQRHGSGSSWSYLPPAMSADGRYVAFTSTAYDLMPAGKDTNGYGGDDVFLRDMLERITHLVSVNLSGNTGPNFSTHRSEYAFISDDGLRVVFTSYAPYLVTNDTNGGKRDVFIRDLSLPQPQTTLVSARSSGGSGNNDSFTMAITPDARYVAFYSLATDLVNVSDTNGQRDAFLRDLQNGTTTLLSVTPSGASTANGTSLPVGISADGRFVVIESDATDLVGSVIDANGFTDVFVREPQAATTALMSINVSGTGSGNSSSYGSVMTDDGKLVAFSSLATDLTSLPDLNGGNSDVLVRPVAPGPEQALTDLIALVRGFSLPQGMENSLTSKLENAQKSLEAGNLSAACGEIGAFVNQVEAQSGKTLTIGQASQLIAAAESIRTMLGCS